MNKNLKKILIVVTIDLVCFAVLLLSFAWFHHAKPKDLNGSVVFPITTFAPIATPALQETPAVNETPSPSVTTAPAGSDTPATDSPSAGPADTPTPEPTVPPTPEPTGLLQGRYAEKFTDGEIIYDENGYRSANVCIEVSEREMTVQWCPVHYFVADIYIKDITSFRCAISEKDDHKEWVTDMANANNAVVAVSGDYFLFHRSGLAIRNGVLYRDRLHSDQDVCVLYQDGTMETYLKGQVDLDYIYSKSPYHAWSFGPRLLENGQPMTEFNTSVETWNPRCAIGYYEPGHYCFVVVDGRQTDYSLGLEMGELSKLMFNLGCKEAYNLDGGMTAMMSYNGSLYSRPCGGGRKNCDILYIAEPLN